MKRLLKKVLADSYSEARAVRARADSAFDAMIATKDVKEREDKQSNYHALESLANIHEAICTGIEIAGSTMEHSVPRFRCHADFLIVDWSQSDMNALKSDVEAIVSEYATNSAVVEYEANPCNSTNPKRKRQIYHLRVDSAYVRNIQNFFLDMADIAKSYEIDDEDFVVAAEIGYKYESERVAPF